jgi:N-methylhydantoinase B
MSAPTVPTSTSTPDGIGRNPQMDPATLQGGPWDGREFGYIPPVDLAVDPRLEFHTEADLDFDPITYQVIRSRFWNINLDHADTIKRVAGSSLIVYVDDFNTSLLTETGDSVVCGPSVQYFTGHGDLVVKWTLENRSSNPGIEDGDVFLQNDPYIGTAHQMDTCIYAPVFWQGKLFCWIFSNCHMGDLGGTVAGGFCPEAPDIFHESTPIPPIKLARNDELLADVAEMFTRKSRTPDMVALQIRSQIAGLRLTKSRIGELLEEYGPAVVKGTMRRMIRDCSKAVGERLLQIPDGEWEENCYIGSAGPDDRDVHRLSTQVRKVGDRMIFSNAGSDPQFFAANATFAAWRSALVSGASMILGFDQMYCPAGAVDHMEFDPTPGTLTVATYPAAVTPLTANILNVYLASQVLGKMAMTGPPELRRTATATGGVCLPGWWVCAGNDRHGNFVADLTGDSLNGSLGAFPLRDGVDTGGAWWWPRSTAGNAEEYEASLPILYLYRREQEDSAGPGRFRGGNGAQIAISVHKTDVLDVAIISTDPAVNPTMGLGGGYPAHAANHLVLSDADISGRMADIGIGRDRPSLEARYGEPERVSPKSYFQMTPGDAFLVDYPGGGGFGDPLTRDPDAVRDDVSLSALTSGAAALRYGVLLAESGKVDDLATDDLRANMVRGRLDAAVPPAVVTSITLETNGTHPCREVGDGLMAVLHDGRAVWACQRCGTSLGAVDENFKDACARLDVDPHELDPQMYPAVSDFCDVEMVLRQYLCPSCGLSMSVQLSRPDDPATWEVRLDAEAALDYLNVAGEPS